MWSTIPFFDILTPMESLYARRRRRFLREMKGGTAVLQTHTVKRRTADQDHVFRANSDFYYLTGLREPEAIAIFAPGQKKQKFTLFVRQKDRTREIWEGRRLGPEAAKRAIGADATYPVDRFGEIFPKLLGTSGTFYHKLGLNPDLDATILKLLDAQSRLRRRGGKVVQ